MSSARVLSSRLGSAAVRTAIPSRTSTIHIPAIATRTYATTTTATSKSSKPSSSAATSSTESAPKKALTNYGKEFRSQKVFLHHTYQSLLTDNRIFLICQHSNMSVPELIQLRIELAKVGATLKVLRLGIFAAALRETRFANLEPLISGPTCAVVCDLTPEQEDADVTGQKGLAGIRKVVEKNKKLILLGGKVDDALVSVTDMEKMVNLPSLGSLRSQIAGLLSQAGGGRLVQVLGMNPTMLVMNLEAHAKGLEEAANGGAAPKAE